jgi:hypothetical protein
VCQLCGLRISQTQDEISFTKIIRTGVSALKNDNYSGVPKMRPFVDGYTQENFIGLESQDASPYEVRDTVDNIDVKDMRSKFLSDRFESKNINLPKGDFITSENYDRNFGYENAKFLFKIKGFLPVIYERYAEEETKALSMAFWHDDAISSFNHYLIGVHVRENNVFNFAQTSDTATCFFAYKFFASPDIITAEKNVKRITSINHYLSRTFYNNAVKDIASLVKEPVTYKIKKYLSQIEVDDLDMSQPFSPNILNGKYMINKISGYNPLSTEATEIELIKIAK